MKSKCFAPVAVLGAPRGLSLSAAGVAGLRMLIMVAAMTLATSVMAITLRSSSHKVKASLQPSTVQLGQNAQLSVTLQGRGTGAPDLPSVSGLQIVPVGQSSSLESVNGQLRNTTSYLYQVTPTREGTFTIPSIAVAGGHTGAVMLKVLQKAPGTPLGSQVPRNLFPSLPGSNPPNDHGTAFANRDMAFLRVITPRHHLYVGETVPVTVKAYFRAGLNASLNGLPTLSSDAFTLNKLGDQPDETTEVVNGVPYTVLTWSSALSAVKAGDYSLGLDLPVLVRVRERSSHSQDPFRSMFPQGMFDDSFFDDSFFDNFFGNVREKPMTLHTDPLKLSVASLPSANRPDDFSGAVGQFSLSSDATPSQVAVGDPVTLKIEVTGDGNFDRVNLPGLETSNVWKTYRVNSTFDATDDSGETGTKTFEQAIVPRKAGPQEIPAIRFSFFDPDLKQYVTRSTAPIPVTVSGSAAPVGVSSTAGPAASAVVAPAFPAVDDALAPDKAEPEPGVHDLRPVFLSPAFVGLQALIVLAALGGLVAQRLHERRQQQSESDRKRTGRPALASSLAQMDEAARTGNATAFLVSARDALREHLATRWQIPPTAVTVAEIDRRLNGDGIQLHDLFAMADRAVYAGLSPGAGQLDQWRRIVTEQLKHVEAL